MAVGVDEDDAANHADFAVVEVPALISVLPRSFAEVAPVAFLEIEAGCWQCLAMRPVYRGEGNVHGC